MRVRNNRSLFAQILVAILFLNGAGTAAADQSVPLPNPGFEQATALDAPVGWRSTITGNTVTEDTATEDQDAGIVSVDRFEPHSGQASLRIEIVRPASVVVESEPVHLVVGQLYRLSGWIRTQKAFSDPMTRYPTAVPAAMSMLSFPLTNHSATAGSDTPWRRIETLFIATKGTDRVRLHLGLNGTATGTAWFDDLSLEKVEKISEYIPPETVRWFGDAYRYDDRGWIFVHIEGEPFDRGYQYGFLLADEIVSYIKKLGVRQNENDPAAGWNTLRFEADTLFLRQYDREYLVEMRGIAAGAAKAGAEFKGRALDLLDIVTVNSVVDIGQLHRAMSVTPHSLTGESFLAAEEELLINYDEHKCSALVATGPATADGQIVFGQIFMWSGYTGVHWNVICDLQPTRGHRLVYHTFPGGIHSGADFYINDAGIIIGETTVSQTPYEPKSTPQSNRIRKAAQYAESIDDVARILRDGNNGMYTNDWPVADIKTGEAAIFLLGTEQSRLWRTGEDMDPFGTPGFLWANNNNRDPDVRKEYIAQPDDRPYDLIFSPWNRDVAFNQFYAKYKGNIDSIAATNLWASSPINRAHACDGKITTSEMAEELVFLAHYGKVTLREKFPQKGYRIMPDLPEAIPHLSLGYSTPSPVFVTERLQAEPRREQEDLPDDDDAEEDEEDELTYELGELEELFKPEKKKLWRQTIYPASDRENWLISATASYWRILHGLDEDAGKAAVSLGEQLAELNDRYLYTVSREKDLAAVTASRAYDRYGPYQIPRIKGTFALHQLRLSLGNERFFKVMNAVHDQYAEKEITNDAFVTLAEEISGSDVGDLVRQWIEREGLPEVKVEAKLKAKRKGKWELTVTTSQQQPAYHLYTHLLVDDGEEKRLYPVEVGGDQELTLVLEKKPVRVVFNALGDFPVQRENFYTFRNFIDDFHQTLIVYGTTRQIEANHTLARRWQETAANAYVEILPPLVKDSELSAEKAASHDLMVLGSLADNSFLERIADKLPVKLGKNHFEWRGETYADSDDGLFLALPNPFNPDRVLYLFLANSALELHEMTKKYPSMPAWALFKGDQIKARGHHEVERFVVEVQ